MADPLLWLGISLFLVAISLITVLAVAIPTLRELGRASRSAERFFDILSRDLPPTLEAIRLTGLEITELTEDVDETVQRASRVAKQVDSSLTSARQKAHQVELGARSLLMGFRAAWRSWRQSSPKRKSRKATARRGPQKTAAQSISSQAIPVSTGPPADVHGQEASVHGAGAPVEHRSAQTHRQPEKFSDLANPSTPEPETGPPSR